MPTAESTAHEGAVTVHVDADHLPGVVHELAVELLDTAEELERRVRKDVGAWGLPSADTATVAMEARRLIELLDQLGWQTDHDASLTADPDELKTRFGALQERGFQELLNFADPNDGDTYINPQRAGRMIRGAYAGASSVLDQLGCDPGSDEAAR